MRERHAEAATCKHRFRRLYCPSGEPVCPRPSHRAGAFALPEEVAVDRLYGPNALLPAFLLARRLALSRQLVNYWHKSGKLEQAGEGVDGRPLFRFIDGAKLEAAMRDNPNSRRKPRRDWDTRDRNSNGGDTTSHGRA